MNSPFASSATTTPSKTLLWGATGEQEWTPALTTGECGGLKIPARHSRLMIFQGFIFHLIELRLKLIH
jgi:hypothetical protein